MNENQKKGRLLAMNLRKEEAQNKIGRATKLLFWVGAINFLFGLFNFIQTGNIFVFIISGVISLTVVGLGFWSRKSPLLALITALIFLGGLFSIDFANFGQIGIIGAAFRGSVLLFLIFGIYNVFVANKIIKAYNELAQESDDSQ